MKLSVVKKRLEAKQCYQSPAEFVSDIRLVFENFAVKVWFAKRLLLSTCHMEIRRHVFILVYLHCRLKQRSPWQAGSSRNCLKNT